MNLTTPKEIGEACEPWAACTACPLHVHRRRVVFYRGDRFPDVLFVGEAPGKVEDRLGHPFVGPAGGLTERMIAKARPELGDFSYAFTNLCCCLPLEDPKRPTGKVRAPYQAEVEACRPRLAATIAAAKPASIILLGKVPGSYSKHFPKTIPVGRLQHPSYVLRSGGLISPPASRWIAELILFLKERVLNDTSPLLSGRKNRG